MKKPEKKPFNKKKVLGYLIGLGLSGFIVYKVGLKAIEDALEKTLDPDIGYLLLSFFSSVIILAISAIRWGYIINSIKGYKVCPYFNYFAYHISGRFFGQHISTLAGDFILRPVVLKKSRNVNLKTGISISLMDKFLDLFFVLIIIGPALLFLFGLLPQPLSIIIIIFLATLLSLLLIVKSRELIHLLKNILLFFINIIRKAKWFKNKIKDKHINSINDIEKNKIFSRNNILFLIFLTVIKYIFLITRIYFLSLAFGLNIPFYFLFIGIPIAQLGLSLGVTPGALGILEGSWYLVLSAAKIPRINMFTFIINRRAYWYIFIAAAFLLTYLLLGLQNIIKSRSKNR